MNRASGIEYRLHDAATTDPPGPRTARRRRGHRRGGLNAVVALGGGGWTRDPAAAPPAQAALVLGAQVQRDGEPERDARGPRARRRRALSRPPGGQGARLGRSRHRRLRRGRRERRSPGGGLGVPARRHLRGPRRLRHPGTAWFAPSRVSRSRPPSSSPSASTSPRALWLARRAGLRASGLAADVGAMGRSRRMLQAREVVARVKAVGDVVTGAGPRFLGPRHPIAGDGRSTLG